MAQSVEEVPPYEQVLLVKKAYIGELCKRKKRNLKRLNQVISPSIVKVGVLNNSVVPALGAGSHTPLVTVSSVCDCHRLLVMLEIPK